jgi:hypothetical protein
LLTRSATKPNRSSLDGPGVVSIRLATLFEQTRDNLAQLFTKIEFRSAKALNKK